MSHTRLWIAAGIIAAVVLGGFVLSVPHTSEVRSTTTVSISTSTPLVSLKDAYKKGVHTITGSLTAPDACTDVTAKISLTGGTTSPRALLAIIMPSTSGICLLLPTLRTFSVTIAGPARLPIDATVNNVVASTTP